MKLPSTCTYIAAAALGAGLALAQLNAGAASPVPAPLASLADSAEQADLVFEGVVEAIEHRTSQLIDPGDQRLPFTFVTFRVEEVFQGSFDDRGNPGRLTLRFLGGPLDGSEGVRLQVSNGAEFELGAREVLQVKNHETWGVPLSQGPVRRLSIQGQQVLTEDGSPLARHAAGPRTQLDDDGTLAPVTEDPMSASELRYWLAQTLDSRAGATVRSVFPHEPFSVAGPRPVAAQLAPVPARPPLDPSERLERALMERNGHNPVLR